MTKIIKLCYICNSLSYESLRRKMTKIIKLCYICNSLIYEFPNGEGRN